MDNEGIRFADDLKPHRSPSCPLFRGLPERSGGWGLLQVCNFSV